MSSASTHPAMLSTIQSLLEWPTTSQGGVKRTWLIAYCDDQRVESRGEENASGGNDEDADEAQRKKIGRFVESDGSSARIVDKNRKVGLEVVSSAWLLRPFVEKWACSNGDETSITDRERRILKTAVEESSKAKPITRTVDGKLLVFTSQRPEPSLLAFGDEPGIDFRSLDTMYCDIAAEAVGQTAPEAGQ